MKRLVFEAEHEAFRETVRQYIERELVPQRRKVGRASGSSTARRSWRRASTG